MTVKGATVSTETCGHDEEATRQYGSDNNDGEDDTDEGDE